MVIDCGSCTMAQIACSDCVVSVMLGAPAGFGAQEMPESHLAAVGALAEGGLVPPLRLIRGTRPDSAAS